MDTATISAADLDAKRAAIRTTMPKVYEAIQRKAAEQGKGVYALVTRALRGEPNCFFAIEGKHVAGTPFVDHPIAPAVAEIMARCGHTMVFMLADVKGGAA